MKPLNKLMALLHLALKVSRSQRTSFMSWKKVVKNKINRTSLFIYTVKLIFRKELCGFRKLQILLTLNSL